jgi:hypothetical protein
MSLGIKQSGVLHVDSLVMFLGVQLSVVRSSDTLGMQLSIVRSSDTLGVQLFVVFLLRRFTRHIIVRHVQVQAKRLFSISRVVKVRSDGAWRFSADRCSVACPG